MRRGVEMEPFLQFGNRIDAFEKRISDFGDGRFAVNRSLARKVSADNSFADYYGDTVVFALSDEMKDSIEQIMSTLRTAVPQCFCEKLVPSTYHMTLHDLSNSAKLSDCAEQMFYNELKIAGLSNALQKFRGVEIVMKSNYVFNMVGTSLVMGLRPIDEENYRLLADLYSLFDGVVGLNYPMTPHVTLAYYNVNGFSAVAARELKNAVDIVNAQTELTFSVRELYYQKFTSMNDYTDIIQLL